MAIYDDILKNMQSSFMMNSPIRTGQTDGFMGNDPDVIKPGGSGPMGGGDNTNPGGNTNTNPSSPNTNNTGGTGNRFGSTFRSISDILAGQGLSGYNLADPASQYGYGSDFSEYFGTFDEAGYNQAMQALQDRESRLFREIGQRFESETGSLQGNLQDSLLSMMGEESTSGLVGGRQAERRRLTRATGEERLEQLGQQTMSSYAGAQEQIGAQIGQLEGSLLDFIGSQANVALNLMQADASREGNNQGNTGYPNVTRGASMTADQLGQFSGIFSDLTNSAAAFNEFVKQAHTNLSTEQLTQLAYDIFNQYQDMDESGGT
jgi:hypothetical protein